MQFIQKTSSKSKSSVLTDCSELDSEIILSECRIVGALEGTRLELGVRLVTLQTGTIQGSTVIFATNLRTLSRLRYATPT